MKENKWLRLPTYVAGLVDQELLLQNEYLAAENRILRAHLPARLRLSNPERSTLAEIGKRLGRKALAQVAQVAKPETIPAWYRRLIARKFDGSKYRSYPGGPRVTSELEALILKMARENSGWGYDYIVGALANLGHRVSDQTSATICGDTGLTRRRNEAKTEPGRVHRVASGGIAFAERWVRSAKQECLSKLILFGEGSLRRALHHAERNHQGKGNILLFPTQDGGSQRRGAIRCRERLGGLLENLQINQLQI